MDETRAQAYANLIAQLLSYPNGEEPQILQANSELLDAEFLQVCEVVADNLAEEGQENAADFLRDLARQLGQLLGMNQGGNSDYLEFLMQLLQTVIDSEGNPQQVYPFLRQNLNKLDLQLVQILTAWAKDTFAKVEAPQANNIAADIGNLGNLIGDFSLGSRLVNLEMAIACYEIVSIVFNRQAFPQEWAQTQNNLAAAYYSRIKGDKADNMEQAIFCYQNALQVRTCVAFPQDWATTQNNLAAAYYSRIKGDKADNIEKAIASFTAALEIRTRNRDEFPEQWAETQNNLGEAYRHKIKGDRSDNIEKAIAFYNAALEVYTTSDDFSKRWAETQNNLGEAYRERIRGDKAENIEQAIALYNAALKVLTREAFPEYWATTQNNLAIAFCQRIEGEKADNIEQAIAAYNLVLQISTREHFPFENVETLNNLGWAYLAKLDHIYLEKPEDTHQRAATLQSAYDTFRDAITGAEYLRKSIQSGDEIKQKHDLEWDRLYRGMVRVCLDRDSNREAMEYAEANKARNLAELIAQKQPNPKTPEPITFSEITQLLTTDTALIEWYITDEEIITFVLTYPDVLTVHRSRQRDELIYLVYEYREEYKQSKTHWQTQLPTYLQRLAEILEITTILPAESTRLILIPHWFLHLFPLHALPLGDDQFLLDKFPQGIQYGPSCQLLQQIKIHPNFDQLLALQNPTLDLPYTDLEVTSIAPKFTINEVIPGAMASKDNLFGQYLAQLENAHCAHFSCHGSFNANDPLRSFLILAGGLIEEEPPQPPLVRGENGVVEALKVPLNKGDLGGTNSGENEEIKVPLNKGDLGGTNSGENEEIKVPLNKGDLGGRYATWRDGKTADITKCLTLEDIFQLQLKQCRLVVLSACETALIDTQSRSDYIGLPTGFLHAGAMGTLASLWAVNDLSTALIMVKFYEALQPGVSIGKALHDTQRWFKSAYRSDLVQWVESSESFDDEQKEHITEILERFKETKKPYSSVYHWGAFCAIGL